MKLTTSQFRLVNYIYPLFPSILGDSVSLNVTMTLSHLNEPFSKSSLHVCKYAPGTIPIYLAKFLHNLVKNNGKGESQEKWLSITCNFYMNLHDY